MADWTIGPLVGINLVLLVLSPIMTAPAALLVVQCKFGTHAGGQLAAEKQLFTSAHRDDGIAPFAVVPPQVAADRMIAAIQCPSCLISCKPAVPASGLAHGA